jgi:hypothetical protein
LSSYKAQETIDLFDPCVALYGKEDSTSRNRLRSFKSKALSELGRHE